MNTQYQEQDTISIPKPKGHLHFDLIDTRTNEIVDSFDDPNIVVNTSRDIIIKRLYENNDAFRVRDAKIGNEVGTGTENDPEAPTLDTVAADMSVIYEIDNIQDINYTDNLSLSYSIFINGFDVIDQYTGIDSIGFTSIGLFAQNGLAFSYRRFPVRTITENININVIWTIYYE